MKIFVAGKVGEEKAAREAMNILREAGHEITFDWTSIPHLKPYDENVEASRNASVLESRGVMEADALVLLAHEKGLGMYVEVGMAIALKKPIFAIGSESTRTMFLFHPLVRRAKSVSEAVDLLGTPQGMSSLNSPPLK